MVTYTGHSPHIVVPNIMSTNIQAIVSNVMQGSRAIFAVEFQWADVPEDGSQMAPRWHAESVDSFLTFCQFIKVEPEDGFMLRAWPNLSDFL